MTDIVERLRDHRRWSRPQNELYMLMDEAADKIDVQRSQIKWQAAEIERLREALENILQTAPWSGEDGHTQCIKEARAALQKDEGE